MRLDKRTRSNALKVARQRLIASFDNYVWPTSCAAATRGIPIGPISKMGPGVSAAHPGLAMSTLKESISIRRVSTVDRCTLRKTILKRALRDRLPTPLGPVFAF